MRPPEPLTFTQATPKRFTKPSKLPGATDTWLNTSRSPIFCIPTGSASERLVRLGAGWPQTVRRALS